LSHLPDINVWIALTFSAHPHHQQAATWFGKQATGSCSFCRMTQQGYLRLISNAKIFGDDAQTLPKAWKSFDTLMSDERVMFRAAPDTVEQEWRLLTGKKQFSAKIWNDAFLAAFAKQGGLKLVTFDKGFRRYSGLSLTLLR